MDAKPILVTYIPPEEIQNVRHIHDSIPEDLRGEYHCILVPTHEKEFRFEVFNSPHTEIEFQELQTKLLTLFKSFE